MQLGASVINQWTFYIVTIMTENNVNDKHAFTVYLVLISVSAEILFTTTLELGIVRCYMNVFINVL